MRKSRILYLDARVNAGKLACLDALQSAYTAYLDLCVSRMLEGRRFTVALKHRKTFFPTSAVLSSQIAKNVQGHAVAIVNGWAASKYAVKISRIIKQAYRDGDISDATRKELCIIGKAQVDCASDAVSQAALDIYWTWLLDPAVVGRTPTVSDRCGMRMTEMTCTLKEVPKKHLTRWWLGFSHLNAGSPRIQVPLKANPYIHCVTDVSKGVLARKDALGRWRFEVVERTVWDKPTVSKNAAKIGIDVGLNVVAATSKGDLLGSDFKPRFDTLHSKIRAIRGHRQRQGLLEDSPRLQRLEARLSGDIKTVVGAVSNQLVAKNPDSIFVVEDLNLRGTAGQKRYAYRALHRSLNLKAACEVVNPAYTSQTCPSCGYVHRANRVGTRFKCKSCGRVSHADVVGAINLLGRSEDKQISGDEHFSSVKRILEERYRQKRNSSLRSFEAPAPVPSGRRPNVAVSLPQGLESNRSCESTALVDSSNF